MKKTLKKLYEVIPFKKECFNVIKKFFKLPSSLTQHLHFKGVFDVHINKNKKFKIYHHGGVEENEIFWKGLEEGWEKKSISLWIELSKNAKSILDIGANTGLYALIAQSMNPSAIIHTFEPIPGVFNILQKNVDINNFPIVNHKLALSDYTGTAKIYMPADSDFAYSVTVNQNALDPETETQELTIKAQTLKSIIEECQITSVDLMKLDVETHEPEVLSGMGEYLLKYKPTMIIEVLNDEIAEKLNHLLDGMNYLYFNIDDATNQVRKVDTITKSDYWNFLICNRTKAKQLSLI